MRDNLICYDVAKRDSQRIVLVVVTLVVGTAAVLAQERARVPDEAAQAKARELIRQIYELQYDATKTSAEKTALARKMLDQAAKTKKDPASHFVLLQVAKGMAVQAGDVDTALDAVDRIAQTYQAGSSEMKVETLFQAAANTRLSEQRSAVVQAAIPLIHGAIEDDDYETASRLVQLALDLARRLRDRSLLKQIVAINKKVAEFGKAYAEIQKDQAVLKDDPTDTDANLAVGRYLCLTKGDWENGLPMLALGSDAELKALAMKDLEWATSADEQVALADEWGELAQTRRGKEKEAFMLRAGAWYQQAQGSLASRLVEVKVQKRLDEIAKGGRVIPRVLAKPPLAIAPFNAASAGEHQQAWAKYLGVPVDREVDLPGGPKLSMVLIPPGEFLMGSTEDVQARVLEKADPVEHERIPSEGPQHRVSITEPFRMSRHEVTRGQFRQFVEETAYKTEAERDGKGGFGLFDGEWRQDPQFVWSADPGFPQTDDHPVVHVSWTDATAFCLWLSQKQGVEYTLPTEAQWEYACRAGTTTLWHCGDNDATLQEHAWFSANADGKTHPVGELKPNAWGLYDTHGNMSEWCADPYGTDYYSQSPQNDPSGPTVGSLRVRRGGCWYSHAGWCRSAFRHNSPPGFRTHILGFRVASVLAATSLAVPKANHTTDADPNADPPTQRPAPRWYADHAEDSIACDNGILRIRPTKLGIIWFDVYHPGDKRWYVNKNNLNLLTLVPGSKWQNTELDRVQPRVEVVSSGDDRLVLRYRFEFPHGAKIYTDVFLRRGQPSVRFVLHQNSGSTKITGFQWHVTFGQAEAVRTLRFDSQRISVEQLPCSFPGGREEVQHVRWFRSLKDLNFFFSGEVTSAPDPSNPEWMTRVLGLKQHVIWGKPMRAQDRFAFEARDQPWQPDWGVPKVRPWIEGLWFVRNGAFPEGDELTFGIDNLLETSTR